MNVVPRMHRAVRQLRNHFLASPVHSERKARAPSQIAPPRERELSAVCVALVLTMPKSHSGNARRDSPLPVNARVKFVLAGNTQPVLIQRACMFRAAHEGPHFAHARQVRSIQAADRAATDDANALHTSPSRQSLHFSARSSLRPDPSHDPPPLLPRRAWRSSRDCCPVLCESSINMPRQHHCILQRRANWYAPAPLRLHPSLSRRYSEMATAFPSARKAASGIFTAVMGV